MCVITGENIEHVPTTQLTGVFSFLFSLIWEQNYAKGIVPNDTNTR